MAIIDAGEAGNEVIDVSELYRSLSCSLQRIVRTAVHAPEPVIEEACQSAWSRLVYHRRRVRRENAQSWLVTTATREVLRLLARGTREVPIDFAEDEELRTRLIDPGPVELVERRDRLERVARLPGRQQRVLWLRGVGFSYDEIARWDGCTKRTVERQLAQARLTLRAAGAA
jgi:RNA polymerase sigma factor (sigma-70 family)